jgi:hypothetical protein
MDLTLTAGCGFGAENLPNTPLCGRSLMPQIRSTHVAMDREVVSGCSDRRF